MIIKENEGFIVNFRNELRPCLPLSGPLKELLITNRLHEWVQPIAVKIYSIKFDPVGKSPTRILGGFSQFNLLLILFKLLMSPSSSGADVN